MRAAMVRRISIMGLPACAEASERICRNLSKLEVVQNAGVVLLYACDHTEPDLVALAREDLPWKAAFPRVAGQGKLDFHIVTDPKTQFVEGAFGLREPDPKLCPMVDLADVGVVIAPGRAFSGDNGDRLGRGGGFYDRLLAGLSPDVWTIGVSFRCQIVEPLPIDSHDIPVKQLVTEAGVADCGNG